MDLGFPGFLPSVFMIVFTLFFEDAFCQVYNWSVPVPLTISVCNNSRGNPLTLSWIYNPITPDPLFIVWSKQGSGSGTIATYTGGSFTQGAAYAGRVTRAGRTAEITIQGPFTAADGGVYQVSVTDSGGKNLLGLANVIFPAVNEPINGSCVETAPDSYTVTCSVDVSPPVTLQLKKGSGTIGSASSNGSLSQTVSSGGTYQCSVAGQGSECVTPNSTEVTCPSDVSTTTTSTEGNTGQARNNDLCYLFFLLLLLLIPILMCVCWRRGIACWHKKKQKDQNSSQAEELENVKIENQSKELENGQNENQSKESEKVKNED